MYSYVIGDKVLKLPEGEIEFNYPIQKVISAEGLFIVLEK